MQLSGRLRRIADFIQPGDRIIDVGTDHAYIPIWLLLQDPGATAVATDIRPGPLERARIDAEYYGVADRLRLLLCDGLALCRPEDADTVVLAGMGGETMAGILAAAALGFLRGSDADRSVDPVNVDLSPVQGIDAGQDFDQC